MFYQAKAPEVVLLKLLQSKLFVKKQNLITMIRISLTKISSNLCHFDAKNFSVQTLSKS